MRSVSGFRVVVFHWPFRVLGLLRSQSHALVKAKHYMTHHKPLTEGLIQHVFCLHTHRAVGCIMFADCIGYCLCIVIKDVLKMLGNGYWILRDGVNAQWTYPMSPFGLNPFTIPYEKICCIFQKYFICGVCVCVYIYGLLYMMLLLSEKYNM